MKKILFILCLIVFYKIPSEASWEKRIYLATYPRSGNHWLRYLIEEATGIATSSAYRDREAYPDPVGKNHLPTRFPWGGFCPKNGYEGTRRYPLPDEPFLIKTHYPLLAKSIKKLNYYKTIRLLRHPVDTFYSNFVFGHPGKKGQHIPRTVLENQIRNWIFFQKYWEEKSDILTVRYEDLCNEPEKYLHIILQWVGYSVSPEDVQRAVKKYPPKEKILKSLKYYRNEDLKLLHQSLLPLMKKYGYELPSLI